MQDWFEQRKDTDFGRSDRVALRVELHPHLLKLAQFLVKFLEQRTGHKRICAQVEHSTQRAVSGRRGYRIVELERLDVAHERVADGAHLANRVRVLGDALAADF